MDTKNSEQLKALAGAMIMHPRATLQEIAELVGLSRATLHRTYGTRERINEQIFSLATKTLNELFNDINLEENDIEKTFLGLIELHYEHQTLLRFLCANPTAIDESKFEAYMNWLNRFFIYGQRKGYFKLDLNANVLTEAFVSLLYGLIESAGRGRIAKTNLTEHIAMCFLKGTKA
ncbi:TetR/AcrR family transcriptional regulator [Thorsellia anophelis]|uniref:TetR/AcrR family transcriptional regulator, mexCD-oprJ operon repressor n=1 Tax=Thorsellia anophelis DSM 18579 TaxID=1123402 RepID=A0A1I0EIX8_9GAMM|nr:AsnC family protein [Thorsellia anophelis]SET44923.1 TetR/AcrR family transcriptional regulator, mexCD-oprJ operon repressor [Thorsellia anophelis DSM 18579]